MLVALGISGGIAAYKACEVASLFVKQGFRVTPVLTRSAAEFVGPPSFEAITGNHVITQMFDSSTNADIDHVAVPTSADLSEVLSAGSGAIGLMARCAHAPPRPNQRAARSRHNTSTAPLHRR